MKKKVLVTQRIPEPGLELLGAECEMDLFEGDSPISREELLERVSGTSGILSLLSDPMDKQVMDAAGPGLKVISNYAVGYNNIDIGEATARGIVVTNTPGVLTETTADLIFALILGSARRVIEGDKFMREGKFKGWMPLLFLGDDVHHKTLGIVGLGRIGQAVARRARGFSMRVLYTGRSRKPSELEAELGAEFTDLDTLLAQSDYVSLCVPLTPETRHLIGEKELNLMKSSAHLINAARGPVVDEAALIRALKEKRIAGAGLDVFENEPALAPGLADCERAVLLPHVGSASTETRTEMAKMAARDLLAVLNGQPPKHPVNPEVLGSKNNIL